MKLYYAHYPALQARFVQFVQQTRQDKLDKWLVIGASSFINRQLQTSLAQQLGALANIHFVTAGSLVSLLDAQAPGEVKPLLPQNFVSSINSLSDTIVSESFQ